MSTNFDDVLSHYGIKGMKWGKRRSRAALAADSPDAAVARSLKGQIKSNRGKVDSLSNKELETLVRRMDLEKRYSSLAASDINPGAKLAKDLLMNVGKQQAQRVLTDAASQALKNK